MRDLDAATWAEIRRLYETSDLSVRQIALQFETNHRRIASRCAAECWRMRSVSPLEVRAAAQLRRSEARRSAKVSAAAAPNAGENVADEKAAAPPKPAPAEGLKPGKRRGRGMAPEQMLSRIVRLAERNLAIMEQHMETENGHTTAEERERSTRTVGTLVRTLEKVTELNTGNDDASAAASADIVAAATAELRRELAERIYRMWGRPKR